MNQKIESQNGVLEDITACTTGRFCLSDDPKMMELKSHTPARIGVGRTGSRYLTKAYLRFRADHAADNDAVMTEVSQETLERLHLPQIQTRCKDKYEMLTRPDLGRLFDDENKAKIKAVCTPNPDVQIYCGDGLSAPCIGANVPDLLPMLTLALKQAGITVGIPFFVRYCRVNTARTIGPLVGAKVTCVLIGERPGLLTDESMSAYIAYNARPDMSESDYTVVSNISRYGMAPVEAGAYIADVIQDLLQKGGK